MSVSSSAIKRRLPAYLLFTCACCANLYDPVGGSNLAERVANYNPHSRRPTRKSLAQGNENIDHRANRSALTQISGGKYSFVVKFGPSSTFLIATDPRLSQPGMHDLRRLLKYLGPHCPIFTVATFAMLLVGVLESAIGALIVPIFDQSFSQVSGPQPATLLRSQPFLSESRAESWE